MVEDGISKQEASQAKRLATIRAKQELQRQQKTLVSEALSTNKSPVNKSNRIVFKSDSSDDEIEPEAKVTKKVDLFGGSDDEFPNLEEENPDILVANKLKGKSAEKLTKLQMTYGGDERFKLDNTFLDEKDQVNEEDFAMEQEKERQLRLLSMVVGRDIPAKHSTTKNQATAMPFQRFDPFNPDHIAWVKAQKKKESEIEDLSKPEPEEVEKPTPIVDERRFFNIDEDFVNELRAKIAEGKKESFTFLKKEEPQSKKFDDSDDEQEELREKMENEDKVPTSKAKMTTQRTLQFNQSFNVSVCHGLAILKRLSGKHSVLLSGRMLEISAVKMQGRRMLID
ncbi:hypothetical protein FO519_000624 [Halicephalobus sp. NKZ332]|nr:hypothetical protein FO519_000624 [Halicephalobus sp. NKZ332]